MDQIRMERGLRLINNLNNVPFQELLEELSRSEFITMSAMKTFMDCNETERININKIAELTCVSVPAISRLIKNLECKKLVKRNIDLFNRRNTFVSITKKGREVLDREWTIVEELYDETFKSMNDEEKERIINTFETMYKNLNDIVEKKIKEKKNAKTI